MTTVEQVSTKKLKSSPYNRRGAGFDVEDLAASIERHGVLQPLIARKVGKSLELVAGERRLRAAKKLKLATLPVIVRELTDTEALEALIEENLQRADIHPMDEAECFEQLRDEYSYTVKQLADRFGKTERHVHKRLSLLGMCKPLRAKYLAGEFDHRVATEIARLADPKSQTAVATAAKKEQESDDWSWKDFQRRVRQEHMLTLSKAPFDIADAKLTKAGACTSCPSRTGCQRELFEEVAKKEDLCLDASCYRKKVDAWWAIESKAAKKRGDKVLSKAETKKVFSFGRLAYNSGFIETEKTVGELAGDYKSNKKLTTALKKDPPQRVLARTDKGEVFELYDRKHAAKKLKAAGVLTKAGATKAATATPAQKAAKTREKNARAKEKLEKQIRTATTTAVIAEASRTCGKIVESKLWGPLARLLCVGFAVDDVAKARGVTREQLEAEIKTLEKAKDVKALRGLVVELVLRDSLPQGAAITALVKGALVAWGVDISAVSKRVRSEFADKAPSKAKAKPKGKKTRKGKRK